MEISRNFLIIDDDKFLTDTFRSTVMKIFPNSTVYSAKDGLKGWEFINKEPVKPVIFIGQSISGINAFQLLKKIRAEKNYENAFISIITQDNSPDENFKTLQNGADDFVTKPLTLDKIFSKVKNGLRIIESKDKLSIIGTKISELNEIVRLNIQSIQDILYNFIMNKYPESEKTIEQISQAANWVATKFELMHEKDIQDLNIAAKLCYLGHLSLPDKLLNTPATKRGFIANPAFNQLPVFTDKILSLLQNYHEIRNIIVHIYENMDGSGFPDKVIGWQIPLGSRILRVAMDFEEQYPQNHHNEGKTMDAIFHECHRLYDLKVVALFDQFLASPNNMRSTAKEVPMEIPELTEGMIVSRFIITESGTVLMSGGLVLNKETLIKISEMTKDDPIIGKIHVRSEKRI